MCSEFHTHTTASAYSETRQHTWCFFAILTTVECCQSQLVAEFGLHMILRKECLWLTQLWGDVDCFYGLIGECTLCPRWPLPPRQKIGGVPQGTGWGHHLIRFWTALSNSGEQIQQTRAKPAGENFPPNSIWRALWLWSMWSPPNPVGSHPAHQVCDAWAAAPYPRSACCGTKPHS